MLRYLFEYSELAGGSMQWYKPHEMADEASTIELTSEGLEAAVAQEAEYVSVTAMAKRGSSWLTSVLLSCFPEGSYMPSSLYQRFFEDEEWQTLPNAIRLLDIVARTFDPTWVNFRPSSADSVSLDDNRPHISVGWLTYIRNDVLSARTVRGAFDVVRAGNGRIIVSDKNWPTNQERIVLVADALRRAIRPPAEWDR